MKMKMKAVNAAVMSAAICLSSLPGMSVPENAVVYAGEQTSVKEILGVIETLLENSPEQNSSAIGVLLEQAIAGAGVDDPAGQMLLSIQVLLDSAVTLINSGVSDDGSLNVLIGKALEQLG